MPKGRKINLTENLIKPPDEFKRIRPPYFSKKIQQIQQVIQGFTVTHFGSVISKDNFNEFNNLRNRKRIKRISELFMALIG